MDTETRLPVDVPLINPVLWNQKPFTDGKQLTFQLKYDGFGAAYYHEADRSRCRFVSKHHLDFPQFRWLRQRLANELTTADAIIHGEIIALNSEGKPRLSSLVGKGRSAGGPIYVAFDLLWLNGKDLRPLPLRERRKRLAKLIARHPGLLFDAAASDGVEAGLAFFEDVVANDLEGMVVKNLTDPYDERTVWYKVLNPSYSDLEWRRKFFNR